METIYLSLSAQVDVGTFFMKSPVVRKTDDRNEYNRQIDRKMIANVQIVRELYRITIDRHRYTYVRQCLDTACFI